ncbi:MAG: tetratricopeptide repeat protein, partial [Erysipelotrichaceae bacterium]
MKPYSTNEFIILLEQVVHVVDPTSALQDYYAWALDSLQDNLNEEGRCTRLYALGYYTYKRGEYEMAKDYAQQAMHAAQQLDLKSYEGRALLLLASIAYRQKDATMLMAEFPHIKELFASQFDYENLAALYLHTISLSKDEIFEAHLYEAYAYAQKYTALNTTERSLDFYLQLGLISKTLLKDPMGAIAHFLKAQTLANRAKKGVFEVLAIIEIGKAFALVPRVTLALQYFQKASQHPAYKKAPVSLRFECLTYYVIALLEAEQFDKASRYLDELIALPLEADLYPQMRRAVVDGLRAEYEIRTNGDFKLGLEYLNRTNEVFLERAKEFSVPYYKQILLMRFGDLYYKSKDYTYALHYYKQLLKLSDSMIWHLKDAYERLALTYEALGDYEQSLAMMQKAYESSVKIDELNDLKRYNLNFDQFLANNSSLLSSTDEEEEIIKEPYVDS